ncbi:DUF4339 domain-containing protein [Gemmata sp. G18]|uniref:DUF4339 domain-containing protein n=1 Tax=Gemmata palustris TaxID=2822762 RepID=A0ABS5BW86_9BACT|nr:DUF4339 domain-containing protein [Gemmata palustris]MBP3957948.1 DUF4339 domain-containing protein [Gemmata palustris]
MESVWYYVVNGDRVGPVTFAELKAVAGAGKLGPADLVWQEGAPDWVAARTVAGLLSAALEPVPSPPEENTYALVPLAPRPSASATTRAIVPVAEVLSLDDDSPPSPRKRSAGPGGGDRVTELVALAQVFVRRAIEPDPSAIAPTTEEGAKLTAAGVMDATARKLAVWRRSVLFVAAVPCTFAALFGLINALAMSKEDREVLSAFGILLQYVLALALFALPVAAVLGALTYDRLALSTKWVLGGGLVSFAVPLVIAFTPTEWLLDLKIDKSESVGAAEVQRTIFGIVMGVTFYIALMPAVLSLLPAVARACVRTKLFLPESLVPGWGLVTSVPLCVLLTLATFVVLYHVASNVLLVMGLVLWIGAPLVYFTKFDLFTRPLTSAAERTAIARTSFIVFALIATGAGLMLIYLFTANFMGRAVLGFSKDAIARPWTLDLHKIWIDYIGRSLFLTVFFSDLLLRIALSVWREERAFAASPEAAGFDRTMTGLGSAVLPR